MAGNEHKARLKARIRALKYFRLIRGPGGGMADHPDRLALELKALTHEDVEEIFATLGVSARPLPLAATENGFGHLRFSERFGDGQPGPVAESPASGVVMVWGVKLYAFRKPGRLEIWIVDDGDAYRITPSAVEAAHAVEPRFARLAGRIVDAKPRGPAAKPRVSHRLAMPLFLLGATLVLVAALEGQAHDATPLSTGAWLVPGLLLVGLAWRTHARYARDATLP